MSCYLITARFPTAGDYSTCLFIVSRQFSTRQITSVVVYKVCWFLLNLRSGWWHLPPSGSDWAWAGEVAPDCLPRLGGWGRAVLKSHLRTLKRSLDTRAPPPGVRQRLRSAKVLTQDHHKGALIGPRPSFEGRVSPSRRGFGGKFRRTWFKKKRKSDPSIGDSIHDSLSRSWCGADVFLPDVLPE